MVNKLYKAIILGSTLSLAVVNAEEIPVGSSLDARVQAVVYDQANVTLVKVKSGVATLIQLSDKEYIGEANSGFAIGDPLAWDISVKQNNIFIRPKDEMPDSNVVFTTNKRTYVLNLVSVDGKYSEDGTPELPTFYLKYQYPQDEKEERERLALAEQQKRKAEHLERQKNNAQRAQLAKPKAPPCTNGNVNLKYFARGDSNIMPYIVWDDGAFTCMKWDGSKDLPIVYRQMSNGTEVLVNTHMNDNVMVIHEVSPSFVLRHDNSVVEIKTDYIQKSGFNRSRTTVRNEQLIKID